MCDIKGCRNRSEMGYYGKHICQECFAKYETDELKQKLGIKNQEVRIENGTDIQ